MLSTQRDKQTGHVYKRAKKSNTNFQQKYDSDEEATIKLECASEDEQLHGVLAVADEIHHTELNMICMDTIDPLRVSTVGGLNVSQTTHVEKQPQTPGMSCEQSVPNDPTIIAMLNILELISERIDRVDTKTDRVQKEIENMKKRLDCIEKKVGISLATMQQVKNVVLIDDPSLLQAASSTLNRSIFNFNVITSEEELTEFDSKLGSDEQYYSNVKQWVTNQIFIDDPFNRMHKAMDLVFDRAFFARCNWSGQSKEEYKIAFGTRTNVIKLFASIGSNKFGTVHEELVKQFFKTKLKHAKSRVNLQGKRETSCVKRIPKY